jgi:protein SCO1/2
MKSQKRLRLGQDAALTGKSGPEVVSGKALASRPGVSRTVVLALAISLMGAAPMLLGGCAKTPAAAAASGIGGPFHLVDQNGAPVDQHILDGKWSAVFFGYTYCPDSCPATLQALGAAARQLGSGTPFQTVFITVDPARDTPAEMKTYLQNQGFPAHAIGLTGLPDQIAAAAKAYGVYYAKSGTGADYTVDHSAAVYLMDPHGRFDRPLAHDMAPNLIAQQIKAAEQGS